MVLRQDKRDFIFVVQCRHIQKRPYGRTPSAVLRQRLGPKTVLRFGDGNGCLAGESTDQRNTF